MGLIKIRKTDRQRGLDNKAYAKVDTLLKGAKSAEEIITRCRAEAERLGLRVEMKGSSSLRLSKMTTTYYKVIRLGTGYPDYHINSKAVLWAHEMVHVYQWRQMGRSTFRSRYVFSTRWRWAIEMQAYRMTVALQKRLGWRDASIQRYIRDRAYRLYHGYAMGLLNFKSMKAATISVLSTAL